MSYLQKSLSKPEAPEPAEPWDSGRSVAPDPSWPPERRLKWYAACTHVLLLNVSERCRRAAAAEADRECAGP